MAKYISIVGARTHNLKNISLELPRNKLIVITGVSGSGKSSLAFDTLYAEGQRRYVESLSAYSRQFLERMDRPDVDEIRGISPAVAIQQKNPSRSSRSTVGTATEIQDYLRLLYARIGHTFCPSCGQEIKKDQVQDVIDRLATLRRGTKIYITFPCDFAREGCENSLTILRSKGFYRLLINGEIVRLDDLQESTDKSFDVLVDRLVLGTDDNQRLADSINMAFSEGNGRMHVHILGGETLHFSRIFECARCGISFIEPQPRLFSFNNPFGACPTCKGFGDIIEIDPDLVIPDKSKSIVQGCIAPWRTDTHRDLLERLMTIAPRHGIDIYKPYEELDEKAKKIIWEGADNYPGLKRFFAWLETKKYKIGVRVMLSRYRGYRRCPDCGGTRLRPEALNVRIAGKHIGEISNMTLAEAREFFTNLSLSEYEEKIAGQILRELNNRLTYLNEIGLGYITIDRRTATLSGGEFQRINLASALGAQLVGSLYILDEPTIGLHPRDTENLIKILKALRDIGNTVIVVEHDREVMRNADHIVDLGPHAGEKGGEIIFQGTYDEIRSTGYSLTGAYLRGNKMIPLPDQRRSPNGRFLKLYGASEHNLKYIDIQIPLGVFVVVTGVSGSGKSSLVHDVLYTRLKKELGEWNKRAGACRKIVGTEYIDQVVLVDQSPIGKTPRSNPATYVKAFDPIRQLFASTRRAQIKGFKPGDFSYNVPGGRCERCQGAGVIKLEMQFLADVFIECDICGGKRYKKDVLDIRYKGKNITDVLETSVNEAIAFFHDQEAIIKKLRLLQEVGLGYIKLGQPATTLSGGEAQRVKLAAHLGDKARKHILYIFDEPTTGLHFDDVATLLHAFEKLLQSGHSLLVIEHNLDVIKNADYIIDLGPGGGENGGQVVASGTPEQVAQCDASHTGKYLREILDN